jgi:hypothetical protein
MSKDEERVIVDTYQGGTDPALGLLNIAAGGVLSDPHRLLVKIYTNPQKAYTCSFSFTGGGAGCTYDYGQYSFGESRPATLYCGGSVFTAGDANPIAVNSFNGQVSGYLLSSNKTGTVNLSIAAPAINLNELCSISIEQGVAVSDITQTLIPDQIIPVTSQWTHNGMPLLDHELVMYVSRVTLWDETVVEFDQSDYLKVDAYVKLRTSDNWGPPTGEGDVSTLTGTDGIGHAKLKVVDPEVKEAEVTVYDCTVDLEEN